MGDEEGWWVEGEEKKAERKKGVSDYRKGIMHIKDLDKRKMVLKGRRENMALRSMKRKHSMECPICVTGEVGKEDRLEMTALFKDWVGIGDLGAAYGVDKKWVQWHFQFTGGYQERESNRGGVFKELVRRGMKAVQRGGVRAPKIGVRDIIQANNSLVQMEGGFKTHIDFTGKLEQIGRQYESLNAEETMKAMEQLIMEIANPNRVMISGSGGMKAISEVLLPVVEVEGREVVSAELDEVEEEGKRNVEHDDSESDVLSDTAAAWWAEGDEGDQHG